MIILLVLALIPVGLGAALQYLVCRLTMRETGPHWKILRLLRALPALLTLALAAGVVWNRLRLWQSESVSPVTQLLFIPGVPGACVLLGLALGGWLFRRRWAPRVFREK